MISETPSMPKKRADHIVHLATPKVPRLLHRKLRMLALRESATLADLVLTLLKTHPLVQAIEKDFRKLTK